MQIGLTIPLQKHLGLRKPPYGEAADLFFCWEIHVIKYQGQETLVVINANNRYSIFMTGIKSSEWKALPKLVKKAVTAGMKAEGYSEEQIERYFKLAGEDVVTKTHGRKPVAGLNRAIEHLYYMPEMLDKRQRYQQFHCEEINRDICSPAGFEEYGQPAAFFKKDMERMGLMKY